MDKFRLILDKIQDCISMQNGATESQLKTLWNDLSDAISENERGQNIDTGESQQLNIAGVSVSLPSTEEIEKVSRARFKGRNHIKWKSEIFKAGANWMKSVVIGYSDVVGSVVAQSEQAVCGHPKPWKNTPWGYRVCPECNDIVEWEQTAP